MSDTQHEETENGGKFWPIFWIAILSLLVFLGIHHWFDREPSYQGKTLTEWLNKMDPDYWSKNGNREPVETAIRQMGPKAVPHLFEKLQLQDQPSPTTQSFEKFVNSICASLKIKFRIRPRPHDSGSAERAKEAFRILGPLAQSTIPACASLLGGTNDPETGALLLSQMGPVAIPALTNVLAGANPKSRRIALRALGQFGATASNAIPLVRFLARGTNHDLACEAILTLRGMGDSAAPFVPQLEQMLADGRYSEAAADTLASLGQHCLLAAALTNAEPQVRRAAFNHLISYRGEWRGPVPGFFFNPDVSFADFRKNFQYGGFHPTWQGIYLLAADLRDPDSVFRGLIADALGYYGVKAWAAIPALTNALADPDADVRRKAAEALQKIDVSFDEGGIVRGPRSEKKIALEFSGHTFAEGGEAILDQLEKHHAKASFFLTGDFLRHPEFTNLIRRILIDGHYLGSHSNKHPLYCPWEGPKTNLISSNAFTLDLNKNEEKIYQIKQWVAAGMYPVSITPSEYWLPPFEWYNQDIVNWSRQMGLALVNYTPGTRANADYTQDSDTNFVSSQAIFDSIVKKEREDPDGLNGFLLLFHLGAGPGRTDKFSARFGELLDYLSTRGYQFVRIDEMMEGK